ncbi:hypothetical protein PG993_009956 [Apiospora rasikravindrae]|uniref:Uncharacterized protein n=1 Tax=Apiospora rasikravindrae TaxID=990691 RepID=A0ABR1SKW1_9PEZI
MGAHIEVLSTVAMTGHVKTVYRQWARVSNDFECLFLFTLIVVVAFGFIMLEVLDEARERQRSRLEENDLEKQTTLRKEVGQESTGPRGAGDHGC